MIGMNSQNIKNQEEIQEAKNTVFDKNNENSNNSKVAVQIEKELQEEYEINSQIFKVRELLEYFFNDDLKKALSKQSNSNNLLIKIFNHQLCANNINEEEKQAINIFYKFGLWVKANPLLAKIALATSIVLYLLFLYWTILGILKLFKWLICSIFNILSMVLSIGFCSNTIQTTEIIAKS